MVNLLDSSLLPAFKISSILVVLNSGQCEQNVPINCGFPGAEARDGSTQHDALFAQEIVSTAAPVHYHELDSLRL